MISQKLYLHFNIIYKAFRLLSSLMCTLMCSIFYQKLSIFPNFCDVCKTYWWCTEKYSNSLYCFFWNSHIISITDVIKPRLRHNFLFIVNILKDFHYASKNAQNAQKFDYFLNVNFEPFSLPWLLSSGKKKWYIYV